MKALAILHRITDLIVGILFALLVVLVLLQVATRFLNIPQTWIDEVSKFVFVWVTYLGGAITVRKGASITFDLVLDSVKGKAYDVLFTIVNVICIIFLAAITVLGTQAAWSNRVQLSTMTRVNMGLMNLAIPIGCVLMIIAQVEYYFTSMKKRKEEQDKQ